MGATCPAHLAVVSLLVVLAMKNTFGVFTLRTVESDQEAQLFLFTNKKNKQT